MSKDITIRKEHFTVSAGLCQNPFNHAYHFPKKKRLYQTFISLQIHGSTFLKEKSIRTSCGKATEEFLLIERPIFYQVLLLEPGKICLGNVDVERRNRHREERIYTFSTFA